MPRLGIHSDPGIGRSSPSEGWSALAFGLWDRPLLSVDGKWVSHIVDFEPRAAKAWVRWCRMHYEEVNADEFPEALTGAWGKLDAYAARLALILHLMDVATLIDLPRGAVPPLPERFIDATARLMVYFKSHARRVYAALEGRADGGGDDVQALLRWIVRKNGEPFSERDIQRNFDRFEHDPDALPSALAWLAARNMIRPSPMNEPKPKPGRKPSPRYEVNPELMTFPTLPTKHGMRVSSEMSEMRREVRGWVCVWEKSGRNTTIGESSETRSTSPK